MTYDDYGKIKLNEINNNKRSYKSKSKSARDLLHIELYLNVL